MKVSELAGAKLDYWVAKALGFPEKETFACGESVGIRISPSDAWCRIIGHDMSPIRLCMDPQTMDPEHRDVGQRA